MIDEKPIRTRYQLLEAAFNERSRRLWAAAEAKAAGRGGFSAVVRATGISRTTLAKACRELDARETLPPDRVRRPGGGRKSTEALYPNVAALIERLVEAATRGDPQSPLRWTCKSTRRIARELSQEGCKVRILMPAL